MTTGSELIHQERVRQILDEGWTSDHDDKHDPGELTSAGLSYALYSRWLLRGRPSHHFDISPLTFWPIDWDQSLWWKPSSDPIRNLVKAGALIAAEIDRLQREAG